MTVSKLEHMGRIIETPPFELHVELEDDEEYYRAGSPRRRCADTSCLMRLSAFVPPPATLSSVGQ